jgi:hypothetical protein
VCQQSPSCRQLLRAQQKEHCLSGASDLIECAGADENLFKTVLNCDETWVYGYNPETKQHLPQ